MKSIPIRLVLKLLILVWLEFRRNSQIIYVERAHTLSEIKQIIYVAWVLELS